MTTNTRGNSQQRAANCIDPTAPTAPTEDDDDEISLTSTVDEAYTLDTEYVVEAVHAENTREGRVLVEWSNFPLDQCTWEPIANLPQELRDDWEQKKQSQDPSVASSFVRRFNAACKKAEEKSRQRHRRRNAKRRKLGLPTTAFYFRGKEYPDSEDELLSVEPPDDETDRGSSDSEFDEAEEEDVVDHEATTALERSKSKKTSRPRNRVFTFDPDKAAPRGKKTTKVDSKQALAKSSKASAQARTSAGLQRSSQDHEGPPNPRYQGSARKSSVAKMPPSRPGNASATKAAPAALMSASGVAEKGLTAKRSKPTGTNIFTEGKTPRQRRSIAQTEVDKSQDAKLYSKHQYRRKAELRSREKEDQAPELAKIPTALFAPGSIPSNNNQDSRDHQLASQDQAMDDADEDHSAPSTLTKEPPRRSKSALVTSSITVPSLAHPKRSSLSMETGRPRKRTKSVRFTGADDEPPEISPADDGPRVSCTEIDVPLVSEPMFLDDVEDSMHDMAISSPTLAPGKAKETCPAKYSSTKLQSVNKKITVSTAPSRILDVSFNSIPRAADEGWLATFIDDESLVFGHTALAETLVAQLKSSWAQGFQMLCSGTITSPEQGDSLGVIAEHLGIMSSGLFTTSNEYNLFIFPMKHDGFEGLEDFGVDTDSAADAKMGYFMFKYQEPICQLIRPFSDTSLGLQVDPGQEKKLLFPNILNKRFSSLVQGPLRSKKRHFFLAFPKGSVDWLNSISSWLFVRDPNSKIYASSGAGTWAAFMAKAETEYGCIILHEAIIPFVRRFPAFARLLQSDYNFTVWCFSETLDLSSTEPEKLGFVPPMPPMLSRLFPTGNAIFITPSFIVSEPEQTFQLVNWLIKYKSKNSLNKLVTAYNLAEYLRDLFNEKCAQQARMENTSWKHMSPLDVTKQKADAALADEDIQARQRAWFHFDYWVENGTGNKAKSSELVDGWTPADRAIDPNDEQSLVNWFGWWSMAHSHEFRKFYVVGSSSSVRRAGSVPSALSRFSRRIKIPKYDQCAVNDPDDATRTTLKKPGNLVEAENAPLSRPVASGVWFRSDFFHDNDRNIHAYLATLPQGHMRVYNKPVCWADMSMADHFGDYKTQFSTIQQWWDYVFPWLEPKKFSRGNFNTYIGFFYTITGEWSASSFPAGLMPRRHPWLVIWRPVDPHNASTEYRHGKTELIIWDVRAGEELEDSASIGLSQLSWMQQELVRFIQLHAHEKNPNSFLDRVWLGGFKAHQAMCESVLPPDITIEYLTMMTRDLKRILPGWDKFILTSGYRPVSLSPTAATTSEASNRRQSSVRDAEDNDLDTRIVFHAPRGCRELKPKGSSNCTNDLFEAATLARLRDPKAEDMMYTFRPTMDWYRQQVAEGRHYEHIIVDDWEKVFDKLKLVRVGKPDRGSLSASSDQGAALRTTRQDSVGSSHSSLSL